MPHFIAILQNKKRICETLALGAFLAKTTISATKTGPSRLVYILDFDLLVVDEKANPFTD